MLERAARRRFAGRRPTATGRWRRAAPARPRSATPRAPLDRPGRDAPQLRRGRESRRCARERPRDRRAASQPRWPSAKATTDRSSGPSAGSCPEWCVVRRLIRTRTADLSAPRALTRCDAPAVAHVVAGTDGLDEQVPLQRIAAADLDARDRRVPRSWPARAGDLAERRGDRRAPPRTGPAGSCSAPRPTWTRRAAARFDDAAVPTTGRRHVADDRLEAHEVVAARILGVGAPGGLRVMPVRPPASGAVRGRRS